MKTSSHQVRSWVKIFYFFSIILLLRSPVYFAQGSWTPKKDFGGISRWAATGFSIGSKGYIGLGNSGVQQADFWEFNPQDNSWTQMNDFTGGPRNHAVGFAIGTKGYVTTGYGSAWEKDLWEFNPVQNTWTKKAVLTGAGRSSAFGFSIGNMGYIGTGYNGSNFYFTDFWAYNSLNNSWTQKVDLGTTANSGRYEAVGFSIGGKGYAGTGFKLGGRLKDFYEYDTTANKWTQKADFGGSDRYIAVAFSIGQKGYVGSGSDLAGFSKDFWEYNPLNDKWTQVADCPGEGRGEAVGFSNGNKGYFGTGYKANPYMKDFWEFDPTGTTGIPESEKNSGSISVYPNPSMAGQFIHFNLAESIIGNEEFEISIFDLQGKIILKNKFSGKSFQLAEPISAGQYFYCITIRDSSKKQYGKFMLE